MFVNNIRQSGIKWKQLFEIRHPIFGKKIQLFAQEDKFAPELSGIRKRKSVSSSRKLKSIFG